MPSKKKKTAAPVKVYDGGGKLKINKTFEEAIRATMLAADKKVERKSQ